jgi:hypothetical protein
MSREKKRFHVSNVVMQHLSLISYRRPRDSDLGLKIPYYQYGHLCHRKLINHIHGGAHVSTYGYR